MKFNLEPKGPTTFEIREARSKTLDIAPVKIPSYPFPVLVAKKIKTFYERGSGKDLYDIFYSLKIVKDVQEIINALKSVLKFEEIEYNEFIKEFIRKLNDEKSIARVHASTNPYIPKKLRVNWIDIATKVKDELEPRL